MITLEEAERIQYLRARQRELFPPVVSRDELREPAHAPLTASIGEILRVKMQGRG